MSRRPIHHHAGFDAGALAEAKGAQRVTLCLPARNEESTVGSIVATVRRSLVEQAGLVDDILVVDDGSTDATASVARSAGARVLRAGDPDGDPTHDLPGAAGIGHGKGQALWRSVLASDGDLIAWCDSDIHDFEPHFVTGLLGPLITHPDVQFVKGFYERPGSERGGGRITELAARPALALLHPGVASVVQPLAGEYAGRRRLLESLPFVTGYGVDVGLLLDAVRAAGPAAVAQVDLGTRRHRNRPLPELSGAATEVLHTILTRAGVDGLPSSVVLQRPGAGPARVRVEELPPPAEVPTGRRRSA